ncbi:MAG: hypothetical protein AAFV93_01195 [Chloroflexota bacterium]
MRKLTCEPNVEVIGSIITTLLDNLQASETQLYLAKHGFEEIDPNAWYSASDWLNVLNDLGEHTNMTSNLVAIGMKVADHAILPPQMQNASFVDFLNFWNKIYHKQHRGGNIGAHIVGRMDETQYRVVSNSLYPDDFVYGVGYGFARRFLPKGTYFTVKYENANYRMDAGGADKTVLIFQWE